MLVMRSLKWSVKYTRVVAVKGTLITLVLAFKNIVSNNFSSAGTDSISTLLSDESLTKSEVVDLVVDLVVDSSPGRHFGFLILSIGILLVISVEDCDNSK